ncbi:hypothetical protein [Paenibacillus sp. GCM10028914]|uniref:hypothetical protein n=1 Tax=Paenibacillus sp. GCM10028914 TaxID=3273416 RepID=UPI0036208732
MTDNNENKDNQASMEEQKEQFRNFVEDIAGGSNGHESAIEEKAHITDNQNRMIDKHNLRK